MISQWPKNDKSSFVSYNYTINVMRLIDKFFLLVRYVIVVNGSDTHSLN